MKKITSILALVAFMALSVSAATWTNYQGSTTATGLPSYALTGFYELSSTWDFAANNAAANDSVQMLIIPPGTLVVNVGYDLVTRETTASACLNVGDSAATNTWVTHTSITNTAAAYTYVLGTAVATTGNAIATNGTPLVLTSTFGKLYTASDYITIQPQTAAVAAKVTVKALCIPLFNK